jgi:hypothetical protein
MSIARMAPNAKIRRTLAAARHTRCHPGRGPYKRHRPDHTTGPGLPRPCSHVCRVENEQASRLPSVRNSNLLRAPFSCLSEPFCEQSGKPSRPCTRTAVRSRWIGGDGVCSRSTSQEDVLGWRVQPCRAVHTPAHTPAIEQLQCGQHPALRLFCRMSKPCRRISTLPHAGQYVLSCGSPGTLPI